jgi:YD repeat-containing protein
MKLQEVILRAMAKKITWWQAAEIIGISDRQMRRWRYRYEQFGYRAVRWRATLAGCPVTVHQHLDETLSITRGPHRLGYYSAKG